MICSLITLVPFIVALAAVISMFIAIALAIRMANE